MTRLTVILCAALCLLSVSVFGRIASHGPASVMLDDLEASLMKKLATPTTSTPVTGINEKCPVAPTLTSLDPPPASLKSAFSRWSGALDELFEGLDTQGAVVTVVYDQKPLFTYEFGTTANTPSTNVTQDTQFAIGSVSKVFTDLMLVLLAQDGKVDLDMQASAVYPELHPLPFPSSMVSLNATLADLGSHMSGIARYSPCDFGNCNITLTEAVDAINEWTLMFPPGSKVSYSNTGFSLLGRILEAPAGMTFEEFLKARVFDPLGMSGSSGSVPKANPNLAHPTYNGKQLPAVDTGFSNPAGGVYSTGNDFAKFMSLFFRDEAAVDSTKDQILDGTTIKEWLAHRQLTNPTDLPSVNWVMYSAWGLPWQVALAQNNASYMANYNRYELITKDGSVPGYHTQLVMDPNLKLGVFSSMTTSGPTFSQFYTQILVFSAFVAIPDVYVALAAQEPAPPVPSNLNDYVGTFQLTYPGPIIINFDVTATATGLTVNAPEELLDSQPAEWRGGDLFQLVSKPGFYCWTPQGGSLDYVFEFGRDTNGKVSTVVFQGMTPRVLHKLNRNTCL